MTYAFDRRRAFDEREEEEERRREESREGEARDRLHRAVDSGDPDVVLEELGEHYPEALARFFGEMGADRSPRRVARDRRERRAADRKLAGRPRKFGRDAEGLEREGFRPDTSHTLDRRHASDMALDAGRAPSLAQVILGEQGMAIERR